MQDPLEPFAYVAPQRQPVAPVVIAQIDSLTTLAS
jgi:hypothetical protein